MTSSPLPLVLAGPVLRRLEPQRLALWMVGSQPLPVQFAFDGTAQVDCQVVPIGKHAYPLAAA